MGTPKKIAIEIKNILDNNFDIKEYFNLLFANILAEKSRDHDQVMVVRQLVTEDSLERYLKKEYSKKSHVILFYAHKPHSSATSPYFPHEPRAHTSVLLCKVNDNKIEYVLNIDGYHFINYVDIMGEQPGSMPNLHIHQRMILQVMGASGTKTPLQRATWTDMNCVLYSFAFVEVILELFKYHPEFINNFFSSKINKLIPNKSIESLAEKILEGLLGKYVVKNGSNYTRDENLQIQYHNQLRENLAFSYQTFQLSEEAIVTNVTAESNKMNSSTAQETPREAAVFTPYHDQEVLETPALSKENKVPNVKKEPNTTIKVEVISGKTLGFTAFHKQEAPHQVPIVEASSGIDPQVHAAIHAVQERRPQSTEGFGLRFIKAIKMLWKEIKSAVEYIITIKFNW